MNVAEVLDTSNERGIESINVSHLSSGLYVITLDESQIEKLLRRKSKI